MLDRLETIELDEHDASMLRRFVLIAMRPERFCALDARQPLQAGDHLSVDSLAKRRLLARFDVSGPERRSNPPVSSPVVPGGIASFAVPRARATQKKIRSLRSPDRKSVVSGNSGTVRVDL